MGKPQETVGRKATGPRFQDSRVTADSVGFLLRRLKCPWDFNFMGGKVASFRHAPETLELAELLAPFNPNVPLADIQRLVGYLESDRTVEVFRQLDGRFNLEKFSKLWRGPVPEDVAEQARAEGFPMPDAFL